MIQKLRIHYKNYKKPNCEKAFENIAEPRALSYNVNKH